MADRDGGPRADPPTSAQGDDYPVFLGDTLVAELLVNKALAMTEARSEEHTSELQSLMRTSYAVFCLKKKIKMIHSNLVIISQNKYALLNLKFNIIFKSLY